MTLFCMGLSFRNTPLEIRETLFIAEADIISCLHDLGGSMSEVAIVSTCNRLEIYGVAEDTMMAQDTILQFFARRHTLPGDELRTYFTMLTDQVAASHLLRVASGLDSMILGESQILGQVTQSIRLAQSARTGGPVLSRLFEIAIHAGKRARTETAIGEHSISVSHAAARLVLELASGGDANLLLLGAGDMAQLAALALHDRGMRNFRIVNRTLEHAQHLAARVGAVAIDWSAMWSVMRDIDIVVCCTGAPHTVIFASDVERLMHERNHHPLTFVDIAVPRDVESTVGEVEGVSCYDIDDLQRVVDEGLASRRQSIPLVEAIVREEAGRFEDWLRARQVAPVITDLRRKLQILAEQELQLTLNRLGHLDERDQALVGQLVHRLINKVLHDPTMTLRERAVNGQTQEYTRIVRDLFALVADEVHIEQ